MMAWGAWSVSSLTEIMWKFPAQTLVEHAQLPATSQLEDQKGA